MTATTESENTESTETACHNRRVRRILRLSGLVLWGLVFVGLAMIWRQRRARRVETLSTRPVLAPLHETPRSASSGTHNSPGATASPGGTGNSFAKVRLAVPHKNRPGFPSIWDPNGIEDFSLTERSGKTVTKADLLGHPWAVCFIFTRCAGPCPRISAQMYELQTALKNKNVRLVTISVDPKYDSPKILRRYAKIFAADPDRWLFLTGDQGSVYRLIHRSFKLPVKEIVGEDRQPGFQVIHSTYILHVDAFGRVRGKYNATVPSDMIALRRALDRDRSAAAYQAWRRPIAAPKPSPEKQAASGSFHQENR